VKSKRQREKSSEEREAWRKPQCSVAANPGRQGNRHLLIEGPISRVIQKPDPIYQRAVSNGQSRPGAYLVRQVDHPGVVADAVLNILHFGTNTAMVFVVEVVNLG